MAIAKKDRDKASRLRRKRRSGKRLTRAEYLWLLAYERRKKADATARKIAAAEKRARSPKAKKRTNARTDAIAVTLALALWTVSGEKRRPRKPKRNDPDYNRKKERYDRLLQAYQRYRQCVENLVSEWEREPAPGRPGTAKATTRFDPIHPPVDVDFPEAFEGEGDDGGDDISPVRAPMSLTITQPELPPASGRAISTVVRYAEGPKSGFWVNTIALTRDWKSAEIQYVRALEKQITKYEVPYVDGISTFCR